MSTIMFFVEGRPQTAGSKKAFTNPKTGKAIVVESGDRNAKGAWREDLRGAARTAIDGEDGWPWAGAIRVEFAFIRLRPQSHFGSGRNALRLKPTAPAEPIARPDVLKTARAVEDALTAILWHDDAAIVDERLLKVWGDQEGVAVTVTRLGYRATLPVYPMEGAADAVAR